MTWIETTPYARAEGRLRELYDRVKGPADNVDNIVLAHSLRPHTLEGHMALYRHVLHHPHNTVEAWFLEALGVYTSLLNACTYCVEHHYAGLARALGDRERAAGMRRALEADDPPRGFDPAQCAALAYARKLTRDAAAIDAADIQTLRDAGWADGEILEINQVAAYFNYANRTVLGLGIDTEGDVLGLSPGGSADTDDGRHR